MLKKELFMKNRENMLSLLKNNEVLVTFAKTIDPNYGANRNFYYLTNVEEDNDIVVLAKLGEKIIERIYISKYDEYKAKWFGRSLYLEEVLELSGIEDIKYLEDFEQDMKELYSNVSTLYLDFGQERSGFVPTYEEVYRDKTLKEFPNLKIENGTTFFATLREVKHPEEIEMVRSAIAITNKGFLKALDEVKPGIYEYQLESFFDQVQKYNGGSGFAFETIMASGVNACVLHYSDNNQILKDGDLVLMDFGARYGLYSSDITRTFPVNGKFSPRQKEIYEIVLRGQKLIFDSIKPGLTCKELNQILIKYYAVELKNIGLIKDDKEVLNYYWHGVSHHIGLDTHDLNNYGPLKAGDIISVEPGLYIKEEGIGIRIEDDALVTKTGSINLSKHVIRDINDIEEYLAKRNK